MAIFVKLFFYISCQIEKVYFFTIVPVEIQAILQENLQKLLNGSQYVYEWLSSDSVAIMGS